MEKPKIEPPKKNTSLFSEDSDDDLFSAKNSGSKISVVETKSAKLKHNLNINVAALLPGAAPRKSKTSPEKERDKDKEDSPEMFPESPMESVDILTSAAKVNTFLKTMYK